MAAAIFERLVDDLSKEPFMAEFKYLKSKSRSHNISYPRQIAMYILKNELSLSLKQIGDLFGGKDHSTVIHAIKTIEEEKRDDSNVEKIIEDILKDIKI